MVFFFYVSLINKKVKNNATLSSLLPKVDEYRRVKVNPMAILDRKIMKRVSAMWSWGSFIAPIYLRNILLEKFWKNSLIDFLTFVLILKDKNLIRREYYYKFM